MIRNTAIVLAACITLLAVPAVKAQTTQKDIRTIAKAANGAVVSVVMSDKGGHAITQGSGFFISADGMILTNYHVIATGSSAIVKLPDGAMYAVDGVLAFDKTRDIAVIQAHGKNFRTLTLGNSNLVQIGDNVVAIGTPLSLESTVSNGIVSGIRVMEKEGGKYLQITAPISPGSSGGPLFNMAGDVVGITTMYVQGGENLNFAIPINDRFSALLSANLYKVKPFPDEPPAEKPTEASTNTRVDPPAVVHDFLDLYNAGGVSPGFDHVCFSQDNKRFFLVTMSEISQRSEFVHIIFYQDGVLDMKHTFMWSTATNAWETEVGQQSSSVGGNTSGVAKEYYELSIEQATGRFKILMRGVGLIHNPRLPDSVTDYGAADIGYKGVCDSIALAVSPDARWR
jgi:Trypsin-like peptidase domain